VKRKVGKLLLDIPDDCADHQNSALLWPNRKQAGATYMPQIRARHDGIASSFIVLCRLWKGISKTAQVNIAHRMA
jgi:hypothetical protein